MQCGTPPVLSLVALECGVDTVLAAEPLGGMPALRAKSLALTRLFINCARARLPELPVVTPEADAQRGSQVSLQGGERGYALVQALIERGVVGDFRAPDLMRFGFTPLSTRFVDAFDAVERLREVLDSGLWRQERFARRTAVT
jgi:kynureninase